MALINETGVIGTLINMTTSNITGSVYLTFIGILLLFIALGFLFKLPMEIVGILILPLLIIFAMVTNLLVPALAFALILLAVFLYRVWDKS
jgi:hypothetical protein